MKTKYTTIFSSHIRPLVSEEKDQHLALASMVDLEKFVPEVDTDANYDLLPVAFNAFVANRVNKNGDVVDTETAIACLLYTSPSPRDAHESRMPSSA